MRSGVRPTIRRAGPAGFLLLFAPVTAEYLIGYDDIIGDPAALVFGLVIFAPLYGAPALLIRELARRGGHGWRSILLLAAAFGTLQAGLIDQSLFNPAYRDISHWPNLHDPTLLPGHWTSLAMLAGFIGGHVVGSISAPIAVAETLAGDRARDPWLTPTALCVVAGVWLAGAAVVVDDTLREETFRISAAQGITTGLVSAGLIVLAFAGRSSRRPGNTRPAPRTAGVVVLAVSCLGVRPLLDSLEVRSATAGGWTATAIGLVIVAGFGSALRLWSTRSGWGQRHVLAVASGALLGIALVAFTVRPIGNVPAAAKYSTNTALLLLLITILLVAGRTARRRTSTHLPDRPDRR